MKAIGLVNGRLVDISESIIPMEDRGHQFGDGVYEVTHVYNGKCFGFKPHMDRLFRSLRELKIPAPFSIDKLQEYHELLLEESEIKNGGIYLQITRGTAPRAHNFPENVVPNLTMSIRPVSSAGNTLREHGATVISVCDERWLRCDIKSLNLLGNVMAKQAAKEAGCFEALLVRNNMVTEGSSSNFFLVKNDVLWTHPISNLILKGVTRTFIIEKILPIVGLKVMEREFDMNFVRQADECLLTGTTTEIMPVIQVDGVTVGDGKPGRITRLIKEEYRKLIQQECYY